MRGRAGSCQQQQLLCCACESAVASATCCLTMPTCQGLGCVAAQELFGAPFHEPLRAGTTRKAMNPAVVPAGREDPSWAGCAKQDRQPLQQSRHTGPAAPRAYGRQRRPHEPSRCRVARYLAGSGGVESQRVHERSQEGGIDEQADHDEARRPQHHLRFDRLKCKPGSQEVEAGRTRDDGGGRWWRAHPTLLCCESVGLLVDSTAWHRISARPPRRPPIVEKTISCRTARPHAGGKPRNRVVARW